MAVWTVKGGRNGEFEDLFLREGLIGKGGKGLPSLETAAAVDQVRDHFAQAYPSFSTKQVATHVGQFWSLRQRMEKGELVVLPLKTTGTIAVGRINGDYIYNESYHDEIRHFRPVEWIATDVARDAFDQDLIYSFGAYITIGRVKRDTAEERILAAVSGKAPTPQPSESDPSSAIDVEAEGPIDIEATAREQIRQFISHSFAGHSLAALVAAVLRAEGFMTNESPPGADQGIDILGGSGPLGLDRPRVVVQVKTGQAGIEEFRSLRGLVTSLDADQGLLVAWRGFKGTVRSEARQDYFKMRLWDADDLIKSILDVYDGLPDDLRSQLPLQRVWSLVQQDA